MREYFLGLYYLFNVVLDLDFTSAFLHNYYIIITLIYSIIFQYIPEIISDITIIHRIKTGSTNKPEHLLFNMPKLILIVVPITIRPHPNIQLLTPSPVSSDPSTLSSELARVCALTGPNICQGNLFSSILKIEPENQQGKKNHTGTDGKENVSSS